MFALFDHSNDRNCSEAGITRMAVCRHFTHQNRFQELFKHRNHFGRCFQIDCRQVSCIHKNIHQDLSIKRFVLNLHSLLSFSILNGFQVSAEQRRDTVRLADAGHSRWRSVLSTTSFQHSVSSGQVSIAQRSLQQRATSSLGQQCDAVSSRSAGRLCGRRRNATVRRSAADRFIVERATADHTARSIVHEAKGLVDHSERNRFQSEHEPATASQCEVFIGRKPV